MDGVTRMAEREVIQVGKNTKVSVLSQRLIERFLEQGFVVSSAERLDRIGSSWRRGCQPSGESCGQSTANS
jgi:hypothetical protein